MSDIPYAAFDPIFWLHHAYAERSIDRCGKCLYALEMLTVYSRSGKQSTRIHTQRHNPTLMALLPTPPEEPRM